MFHMVNGSCLASRHPLCGLSRRASERQAPPHHPAHLAHHWSHSDCAGLLLAYTDAARTIGSDFPTLLTGWGLSTSQGGSGAAPFAIG